MGDAGIPRSKALGILRNPLTVLIALCGGAGLGWYLPQIADKLKPAGDVYLFLLQMTLIPILVTAVASGTAKLAQRAHAGRIILRSAGVLLLFFIVVAGIALAAGLLGHPGRDIGREKTAYLVDLIRGSTQGTDISISLSAAVPERARSSLLDLFANVIPRNVFESLTLGSAVQVMVFALLFGMALGLLKEKQRDFLTDIAEKTLDAFTRVNVWLIHALPLGAVLLVSYQVAHADLTVLSAIGRFLGIMAATLAAGILAFAAAVRLRTRQSLRSVISAMVEPLTYALITGDSLLSIPYAVRALSGRLGADADSTRAAVPVAMVVGRYGYLLYYMLAGIFIADFYGVVLYPTDYLILSAGSLVAALSTQVSAVAGSLAMMSLAIGPLGLPAEPIATVFASANLVIGPLIAVFETQANIAVSAFIAGHGGIRERGPVKVRRISLRSSILALLAGLIVLTGVVTIGLMYSGQRRNISFLADGMIAEIGERVTQRTGAYFSPAERTIASLRFTLENGLVDPADARALLKVMRSSVSDNPEFAAVYFGDDAGNFTMVKRMPDGSLSNRIIRRGPDGVDVLWEHANPEYAAAFPSGRESLRTGYDPRTRGWYKDASGTGERIWTDVYLFASDNMLGISNAVPIRRGGTRVGVLAADIGLAELSYFLGSLDIAETGRAYILDGKNRLVALSLTRGSSLSALFPGAPTGSAQSTANLLFADESADGLVRGSFLASIRAAGAEGSFSFAAEGGKYLSRIIGFPKSAVFNDWKIGIVIPEARIYEYVDQTSRIVLFAAFLIMAVAIGTGVSFSRAIAFPLRRLSREMERIRNFDLGGQEVISSRVSEVHSMADAFQNMKHGLSAFNKYVPSKLVAELIRLGEEPKIGGKRRELTLLFSDVADFTAISESLSPEALAQEMAVYFNALSNVIMNRRGTVDKYIGDAVMAFWNAPAEVEDHAELACLSALECQEALRRLQKNKDGPSAQRSFFSTRTRMGIHTGDVIVGNMGSPERLNYTAIGDNVNLASRLEGLNKMYGTRIIISGSTRAAAGAAVTTRLLDKAAVKGKTEGILIYELLDPAVDSGPIGKGFPEATTRAVERYLAAEFGRALSLIAEADGMRPGDAALAVIRKRCEAFLKSPPPPDWDGVYVYHEK